MFSRYVTEWAKAVVGGLHVSVSTIAIRQCVRRLALIAPRSVISVNTATLTDDFSSDYISSHELKGGLSFRQEPKELSRLATYVGTTVQSKRDT